MRTDNVWMKIWSQKNTISQSRGTVFRIFHTLNSHTQHTFALSRCSQNFPLCAYMLCIHFQASMLRKLLCVTNTPGLGNAAATVWVCWYTRRIADEQHPIIDHTLPLARWHLLICWILSIQQQHMVHNRAEQSKAEHGRAYQHQHQHQEHLLHDDVPSYAYQQTSYARIHRAHYPSLSPSECPINSVRSHTHTYTSRTLSYQ